MKITLKVLCLLIITLLSGRSDAFAYSADHYAPESRLSSGRWVRIGIKEEGMQFLSKSALASMGFQNPDKVKVFGYGGRVISEKLTESMPDDLPEIPVVRTGGGIMFYGAGITKWSAEQTSESARKYTHEINPYSTESYYFLTENEEPAQKLVKIHSAGNGGYVVKSTFRDRLVHENDQYAIGVSGRELFGEDLRSVRTRAFPFRLEDNTGGKIQFKVTAVGERNSKYGISVNGVNASTTTTSVYDSAVPYSYVTSVGSASVDGPSLQFQVNYSPAGGGSHAAHLDYIEIEYERHLRLTDNELCFHDVVTEPAAYQISGCGSETVIWDVTDPASIREVDFALEGGNAVFSVRTPGYYEFVAFNPKATGKTPVDGGVVANQNLHSLPTPDMVIITLPEFRAQSESIAALHAKHDGMEVIVVEPQEIYNEFSSGAADVSAFRKFLKMLYDRGIDENGNSKLGYCLLMGAPTYDNRALSEGVRNSGVKFLPIYQSAGAPGELGSYSTDDIIAQIADEKDLRNLRSDKMLIAIGRIPARTKEDADNAVRKIQNYIEEPQFGSWRNNVMMIADDQNSAAHLEQSETAFSQAVQSGGNGLKFEKIYLDAFERVSSPLGLTFPDARKKMFELWKNGVMFISYVGHGSPRTWTHENLLTWTDVNSLVNQKMPFMYAATCEFARWDDDTPSAAEIMLFNPKGGVIAMICPSRSVYISNNGVLTEKMAQFFFVRDEEGNGPRMGDIMKNGKNAMMLDDSNKLRFCMLGDPALRLKLPTHTSRVDEIGEVTLSGDNDAQEDVILKALDNKEITGVVLTPDGEVDSSFNGVLEFTLMDAETVVETNGWEDENGNNGKVSYYNDHLNRLTTGKTRVENGQWTTKIFIPKDIDNNTTPAQLITYAFDPESGNEANGATNNLFVYGYTDDRDIDENGPEIQKFVLNNDAFNNGDLVHASPLVFASFKDEQGINVSDSGIGHRITLTLDRTTYFDDVNQYYSSDLDDPTAGAITYPLSELEPGEHSLTLTVWDNANNSSTSTIRFIVGVNMNPSILDVTSYLDKEAESMIFKVTTDYSSDVLGCSIEVFALDGKKVWDGSAADAMSDSGVITHKWNMCDNAGRRVSRGIYIYRATVVTPEGRHTSKSKKIAVGSSTK